MTGCFERIAEAVSVVRRYTAMEARVGIVLAAGLGRLTEQMAISARIEYGALPHFPSGAPHSGALVMGELFGKRVVMLSSPGCEGYPLEQSAFPVRVAKALGIQTLVVSGEATRLNPNHPPGSIMVVTDHLNYLGDNPLIGPNDDRLGPRFPDMRAPYSPELIRLAETIAVDLGIHLWSGVYAASGVICQQRAEEIRFLRNAGADAVGRGMVPEVIVAVHAGLKVLGLARIDGACGSAGGSRRCIGFDALAGLIAGCVAKMPV